jgi:UDPglucose 6-dehydrogenase
MNITIYGAGYVGLVTGTCLAEHGHHVLCIDIDKDKIQALNQGECPIYEPGLLELLEKNRAAKRLQFSNHFEEGVQFATLQFICVNTPSQSNGAANIDNVLSVSKTIATTMPDYRLIINKSTAPPGTVAQINNVIQETLSKRGVTYSYDVASNPEFLKEGAAVHDCLHPDRVIIGVASEKAAAMLKDVYQTFSNQLLLMDIVSAELTKYAANAMLATKISFINEIANIAECVGANISAIRQGLSLDLRIGPHFINPGCGYGGSCFPKDVRALIHTAEQNDIAPHLLQAVENVNQHQKLKLFQQLQHYFGNLENRVIAVWGLAFKPNTNDIREASSLTLIENLLQTYAKVQAYDPIAMPEFRRLYPSRDDLILCTSKEACLDNADALVIVTEWNEFFQADLSVIKAKLKTPVIFDGRNLFEATVVKDYGIKYFGIGTR